MTNIYERAVAAGLTISSHESDLYIKSTPEADELIRVHRLTAATANERKFVADDGTGVWWDCPFAYQPYWDARTRGGSP